jgi:hypothetical protein
MPRIDHCGVPFGAIVIQSWAIQCLGAWSPISRSNADAGQTSSLERDLSSQC